MKTDKSYIAKVELGQTNIGIDNIEKFAKFFGVKYYEMVNPTFPIPTYEQMPKRIRDLKENVKKYKSDAPKGQRIKLAPYIDELLKTEFMKEPRTLNEIAEALKNKVVVPTKKIAVLFSKHPRNKIVRTIPGEVWGGRVNKYVLI